MMIDVRSYAEFEADFPDDIVFSEEGEIEIPGGKNVLTVLRDILIRLGFNISSIGQHSYYGWDMIASDEKYKYWFMLQGGEPWLLIAEPRAGFFVRRSKARACLRECLVELNRELAGDRRFSAVRWYTSREYDEGKRTGASAP